MRLELCEFGIHEILGFEYIILYDNFRNVPSIVIFRKSGKLTQFSKCVKIMHNSFSADFGPLGFSIFLIYIKFAKT